VSDLKHTKGPFQIETRDANADHTDVLGRHFVVRPCGDQYHQYRGAIAMCFDGRPFVNAITQEEAEANAELILDAFTTTEKVGLTPSQLAAELDEYARAMTEMYRFAQKWTAPASYRNDHVAALIERHKRRQSAGQTEQETAA
jgi:hypothetical protein